jgi:hypothetical protein
MRKIRTKVVGVTARNDDGTRRQEIAELLGPGHDLELIRDRYNEHDENAVEVHDPLQGQVGFLRRELAEEVAGLLDSGIPVEAVVLALTGGDGSKKYGVNIELRIFDGDTAEDRAKQGAASIQAEQEEIRLKQRAETYRREELEAAQRKEDEGRKMLILAGLFILAVIALLIYIFF